ncbi:MAG: hypothetical protein CIT01_00685 [Methanobacterium sp. BRmetb2]|nr:MAG: hypothetical protein CIT01_00685 [Methanobacterium sp. BRmetb2]
MKGLQSFYKAFYGHSFYRHFRRPPDFNLKKFRIQFTVENPKTLYLHVHRNSSHHPCLIHTYDYGSKGNLRERNKSKIVFDRAFFDFDVTNPQIKEIKNELISLRSHGLNYQKEKQEDLTEILQKLIIKKKVAKPAIDEAKDFALKFKETFGKEPALFFSGCKGCHAYTFFKASSFKNIDLALSWFAEHIKNTYNYETLDLSVNRDSTARLSRIPYSKHQITQLAVVSFTIDDDYLEIMRKSLNPYVEPFEIEDHSTNFHKHLQKIDLVESFNANVKKTTKPKNVALSGNFNNQRNLNDHRIFFRSILGNPVREYPEKNYVMYQCPFPDHTDIKPSFMVHKCGYQCYSCQKKGNYWQFLKDYYNLSDIQVKKCLKEML